MGIVGTKSISIDYKTGINKIIFEYCHFPHLFEDELKRKTQNIYKKSHGYIEELKRYEKDGYIKDFGNTIFVYVNHSDDWDLMYKDVKSNKSSLVNYLFYRKQKYDEMVGIKYNFRYNKMYIDY